MSKRYDEQGPTLTPWTLKINALKKEEAGQRKSYEKGRWGFVQQNMIDRIAQISSSFAVNCSRIYPKEMKILWFQSLRFSYLSSVILLLNTLFAHYTHLFCDQESLWVALEMFVSDIPATDKGPAPLASYCSGLLGRRQNKSSFC